MSWLARAWAWLRAHAWLAWALLGAGLATGLQLLVRRRSVVAKVQPHPATSPEAERAAGRAEAHEAEADRAAQARREIQEDIDQHDRELAEEPKLQEVSNAAERARILTGRGF